MGPRPSPAPTGPGPGLDQALAVREGWQPDELRCAAAIDRRPFFSGLNRIFRVPSGLREVVSG